jgi:SNF2 family DNA or RNA helicase
LTLPPIESKTIMVEFSQAEREFYDALHRKSLSLFEGFIKAGTASKSWLAIFSLLHRLRMTCDHVALTVKSHLDEDDWNANITQGGTANAVEADAATTSKSPTPAVTEAQSKDSIDQQVCTLLLDSSFLVFNVNLDCALLTTFARFSCRSFWKI